MTESENINAQNLARLRVAEHALSNCGFQPEEVLMNSEKKTCLLMINGLISEHEKRLLESLEE